MISIKTDKTYGNLQCCRCLFIFHDIFHTCWSIQLSCIFKVSRAPTSHYHNIMVIVLLDTRNYVTVWMTLSCYSMQLRSIHCILISSWVFTLVYITWCVSCPYLIIWHINFLCIDHIIIYSFVHVLLIYSYGCMLYLLTTKYSYCYIFICGCPAYIRLVLTLLYITFCLSSYCSYYILS